MPIYTALIEIGPHQQSTGTIIEIRPFRNGWQCFEAPGVEPYWTGETAKENAINYAKGRACFRSGEIRILDSAGNIEHTIHFNEADRKL